MAHANADWEQLKSFTKELGIDGEFWLCRGAVRCQILGDLRRWDDFDVVTDAAEIELHSAIVRLGIRVARTYHGGYSLTLECGRKADLWPLWITRGKRCSCLLEALSSFEFNVDAIARSLSTGELVDPLCVKNEITDRKLRLLNFEDFTQNSYAPLKAAYLVLRHDFVPTEPLQSVWSDLPKIEAIPTSAIMRLKQELSWSNINIDRERIENITSKYHGLDKYIKILLN